MSGFWKTDEERQPGKTQKRSMSLNQEEWQDPNGDEKPITITITMMMMMRISVKMMTTITRYNNDD